MAVMGQSRLNAFRLNAGRLNAYNAFYIVEINGVARNLRIAGASITHQLNHLPDTASFRVRGFVPIAGQRIDVWSGQKDRAHQLFGGRILEVVALYESKPSNVAYDISCIDPTWLLDRQTFSWIWGGVSATTIVNSIVANWTRGVTTNNVAANLPTLDEISFTNERISNALSRIADRIGAYWYVDYAGDLHFFLDEGLTAEPITQAAPRGSRNHTLTEDLSQVSTRVIGRGGGASAVIDVPPGATSIPINEPTWYSASGGTLESGVNVFTYTGVAGTAEGGANTGTVFGPNSIGTGSPWGMFELLQAQSSGTHLSPGRYYIGITNANATGETTTFNVVADLVAPNNEFWLYPRNKPTDTAIDRFKVYATNAPNLSPAQRGNILDPVVNGQDYWPYALVDTANFVNITNGTRYKAPPTQNTAGDSSVPIPAGATSLQLDDLAPFPSSGWAVAPGDQYFSYTGKSAASGPGTLTGIPASGYGALTAPVRSGTIKVVPHLIGIPANPNPGTFWFTIKAGEEISIRVNVLDAAAASDLATRLNIAPVTQADGDFHTFVADGRYGLLELTRVVQAYLNDRKTPRQTVTFESRDDSLQIGRNVSINLTTPPIVGTFRIQEVAFSELAIGGAAKYLRPLRRVTASNKLYSFADVLRRVRGSN